MGGFLLGLELKTVVVDSNFGEKTAFDETGPRPCQI